MTKKKPQIRFNLSIYEDIKRFCDDHGSSRDFELVVTPLDESESNERWESQRQLMKAIDPVEDQQKKRPSKKLPSAKPPKKLLREKQPTKLQENPQSSKRVSKNEDNNSGEARESEEDTSSSPFKAHETERQNPKPDSEDPSLPVRRFKKRKLSVAQESSPNNEIIDLHKDASTKSKKIDEASSSHPGFHNPALMCYMNATLQAIFASAELCKYLSGLTVTYPSDKDDPRLMLFSLIWLSQCASQDESLDDSIDLSKVVDYLGIHLAQKRLDFDPEIQHDAHEFVMLMLDALQSDILKYADAQKEIKKDLFMLTSSFLPTTCNSCGENVSPSNKLEHLIYNIDMVDTEAGESIQELIDKNLVADFQQRCCQNDIKCPSQINHLPKILLVGLKRYTEGRRKISTSLEISVELVLAKFQAENATYETLPANHHTSHVYSLVGIVNHAGANMTKGHYIAYIKDRTKDTWLKCDDSKVKEVDLSAALCDSTKACYILVYEAVDDVEMESIGETDEENGRDASEEEVE